MRIVYYTCGGLTRGSTRLRAIVPGRYLRKLGCEVVFNPPGYVPADVAVFQKRADLSTYMTRYRRGGSLVVMDVSDYGRYPAALAHLTVIGTAHLQQWYPNAIIIPDVLDISGKVKPKTTHSRVLSKPVWFGTPENTIQAGPAANACRILGMPLTMISNHNSRNAVRLPGTYRRTWQLATIDSILVNYDLAVCPFILAECKDFKSTRSQNYLSCKSINRPLKAWALGLPVIGSPIPSYVECGVKYLATTVDDWLERLADLQDKQSRKEDAERGAIIAKDYRVSVIARRWLEVFKTPISRGGESGNEGCSRGSSQCTCT